MLQHYAVPGRIMSKCDAEIGWQIYTEETAESMKRAFFAAICFYAEER